MKTISRAKTGMKDGEGGWPELIKKRLHISNLERWKSVVLGESVSCSHSALWRWTDLRVEALCAFQWKEDAQHYGLEPTC